MNLPVKYNFKDFTLENYKYILSLIKEKFKTITFDEVFNSEQKSKILLLRHDIEFSVAIALKMAEMEKEQGLLSTYFIQLHSEFYNPLDKDSFEAINRIKELGHKLGLHFDAHFWNVRNEYELEKYLEIDKSTLETYFRVTIDAFSFHNTNNFILSFNKEKYANLVNVYSKKIMSEFGYCTDSTGYWRYERLEDRIKSGNDDKLHILIHDGMWQNEILPPRQRVFKVIDERAAYLKKLYDETLKRFGAKNIDWEEIY